MSKPVPFIPQEFIVDTICAGMTAEETGAFIMLLAAAWDRGIGIEDDDKAIARMVRVTVPKWRNKIRPTLAPFFDLSLGRWTPINRHLEERARLPTGEWAALRAFIFDRDCDTCQYCGVVGGRLECDHIIPVSRGGSNDPSNLSTACYDCNRAKGALTVEEWRALS